MTLLNLPPPLWTATELAEATGGRWVQAPSASWVPTGVSYARRLKYIRPGDIYLTMDSRTRKLKSDPTAVWDTADMLPELVAAGISTIVAHRDIASAPAHLPLLRVPDARRALLGMGEAARARFTGRAIAITGTVGKTTTKEMLRHVLGRQGSAFATRANFNTWLGVPLSLAETPRDTRYAIYETAMVSLMRQSGPMTLMVRPHAAIFTAIGHGPDEHADSIEVTADYKARIFQGLEPGGAAIINRDMQLFERVHELAQRYEAPRIVLFGRHPEAQVRVLEVDLQPEHSRVTAAVHGERVEYEIPLPGSAMVMNTLAVLAAVHAIGANWRRAAADLASYETREGRLRRFRIPIPGGDFELIDDTFNAEQASMLANFEVLSLARPATGGRRIAVLGEIGDLLDPKPIHAELAAPILKAGVDRVLTLGEGLIHLRDVLPEQLLGAHAQSAEQLAAAVFAEVQPGDVVSAKGCSVTANFDRVVRNLRRGGSSGIVAPQLSGGSPGAEPSGPPAAVSAPWRNHVMVRSRYKVDVSFVGDTYFGESYQRRRARRGETDYLKAHGYAYSAKNFESFLHRADLVVANLEAALTAQSRSPFAGTKGWIHGANPASTVRTLQDYNIGSVALGNNHAADYGELGLVETLSTLDERGVCAFGAGANAAEAEQPLQVSVQLRDRSLGLSVFSACWYRPRYDEEFAAYATADHGGVASMSTGLLEAITALKRADPERFVIVFPHWGQNYKWRTENQQEMADWLFAAGADLVIGHGSHMMQEIEWRSGRWVVYSLGNFIMNSDGMYGKHGAPPYSLLARLRLTHDARGIDKALYLYPILSDNAATLFRPRFVDASEFAAVVERLSGRSPELDPGKAPVATGRDDHGWYIRLALA
jgi:UDP-N-acetylmuramoyl-tripeptide--D-alanyl-D-alanine ligase